MNALSVIIRFLASVLFNWALAWYRRRQIKKVFINAPLTKQEEISSIDNLP